MRFLSPIWLWAIALIPVGFIYLELDSKRRLKRFSAFAARAAWLRIAPEFDPSARRRKGWFWLFALAFLFLALVRPQWGKHEEAVKTVGLDVMIALDVSNSMNVEDVVPNRLKKARHFIRTLLNRLDGDRVGIVAFAGSSYVACPLTTDLEYVNETIEVLSPDSVTNQGTDLGIAIETAVRAMDRGAEQTGVESTAQASRVVLLLTDGEDHIEQLDEAIEIARKSAVKLYVFGIGTDKGGPVPVRDENGQARGYKRDRSGAAIVSSLNTKALTGLAAAVGGKYWNVTADEYEIDELLQELGALNRAEGIAKRVVVYKERFQIPLAISVFLFLLELCLAARKRRSVKYGAALVLVAVTGLFSTKVYAAPLETYLANEKGIKALSEGKVDEARKQFGDAQARNPDLPELLFNQGVVQLQGGDAESAVQAFAGAAKAAEQKNQPGLVGRSLYNLGGVQAQKGDVPGAVRSYAAAIERAKLAHDTKLEADARKNLELLVQQQQQQQKQKQDQKQDQKQEKDQKQDQKQQQQEQKQDQQQKQDQKYSETPRRKQQFNSPKLSKEDADRVMAELSNRERELQAKLKKQKGKATAVQKDW